MLKFAASGSGTVVSGAYMHMHAQRLNVLKCELPSRVLAGSYVQCSMFINQSTISRGSRFA